MKCVVNWIPLRIRVLSRNTHLKSKILRLQTLQRRRNLDRFGKVHYIRHCWIGKKRENGMSNLKNPKDVRSQITRKCRHTTEKFGNRTPWRHGKPCPNSKRPVGTGVGVRDHLYNGSNSLQAGPSRVVEANAGTQEQGRELALAYMCTFVLRQGRQRGGSQKQSQAQRNCVDSCMSVGASIVVTGIRGRCMLEWVCVSRQRGGGWECVSRPRGAWLRHHC